MKVLMFGWEFPPFNSGGLGTACLGLTKGLAALGINVHFVIPKAPKSLKPNHSHVQLSIASRVTADRPLTEEELKAIPGLQFTQVNTLISPYMTEAEYKQRYHEYLKAQANGTLSQIQNDETDTVYGNDLYDEVIRYTHKAALLAARNDFDVIHAHDWMTYKAGIVAKAISGKPLVLHIHATEFDRTGGSCNQAVYNIEREGFHAADRILAVSQLTKNMVVQHYGVPPEKVSVVHNAVEFNEASNAPRTNAEKSKLSTTDKIVLFLGRITLQKGPEYFVHAAAQVLTKRPDTTFVIAGGGDMEKRMVELAASLGIGKKMIFTGWLRGADIDRAYRMADLYVMPSVSEPFGITPLEAMRNGTPVIISKTSGVSEVIGHALKVDFWDTKMMASKIVSVLSLPALHEAMQENGRTEVQKFDWKKPAQLCANAYNDVLRGRM